MSLHPRHSGSDSGGEPWNATQAQTAVATQLEPDSPDAAPRASADLGKQVGDGRREWFVSCDAAQALMQHFEHARPEFLALHDLGTASSRKLLAGVATAGHCVMQQLVIRRQGLGTPLAVLEYIDLRAGGGSSLRIYTTQADCSDAATRVAVAQILMGFSRLSAIIVGDMLPELFTASLKPLRAAMLDGPWPNRHLLMLPLSAATAAGSHGSDLGRGTGVNVRTTPQLTRLADAWTFISGTWNRLREEIAATAGPGRKLPSLPSASPRAVLAAASAAMPMQAMPVVGPSTAVRSADQPLVRYLNQLLDLTGMVSCCIFEIASGKSVVHVGARPDGEALGQHGLEMLNALLGVASGLGLGQALPEAAVTLGAHHLLLRPIPRHPGLALHAVLDKAQANLTLARLQIGRMDTVFDTHAG